MGREGAAQRRDAVSKPQEACRTRCFFDFEPEQVGLRSKRSLRRRPRPLEVHLQGGSGGRGCEGQVPAVTGPQKTGKANNHVHPNRVLWPGSLTVAC